MSDQLSVHYRSLSLESSVIGKQSVKKESCSKASGVSSLPGEWRDLGLSFKGRAPDGSHLRKESGSSLAFDEEFNTLDESLLSQKGMVKSHYIDKKERKSCVGCNKKFTLKKRPRHCRRCGEVLCMKCLRYKMYLNRLAHPDPAGKQRKVCLLCFEEDVGIAGCTRNLTSEFLDERQLAKHARVLNQRAQSLTTSFWRDQLDIQKECRRLLFGFKRSVGDSKSTVTLQSIQGMVKPPDWQIPTFWQMEKMSDNCRLCKGSLGVRKSKRSCKVCGLALCKKCSLNELLIFYDDQDTDGKREAKLAIINVHGCPDMEPVVSLMLRVCRDCKKSISDRQILNPSWFKLAGGQTGPLDDLVWMNDVFTQFQITITAAVSQCEQSLESLEDCSGPSDKEFLNKILMKLGKYLDEYEEQFKRLKSFLPRTRTKTEKVFVQNYTKSKYDFFMENKYSYRSFQKQNRIKRV